METKKFTLVIEATLFTEAAKLLGRIDECQTPKLVTESKQLGKVELTGERLQLLADVLPNLANALSHELQSKIEVMRFQVEIATPKPESEEVKDVRSIFS